jgi:hypothetical protein
MAWVSVCKIALLHPALKCKCSICVSRHGVPPIETISGDNRPVTHTCGSRRQVLRIDLLDTVLLFVRVNNRPRVLAALLLQPAQGAASGRLIRGYPGHRGKFVKSTATPAVVV